MSDQFTLAQYDEAADAIRARTRHQPRIGLILGSGLGVLADSALDADTISYAEIPNFPVSTVAGHAGRLVIGELAGAQVAIMQGRFHYYEGWTPQQVVFPVRVMRRLGIEILILTNAAGGLNPTFATGDVMLITDHLNFVGMAGNNPLRGANIDEFGVRFPAANRIYTRRMRDLARHVAADEGIALREGVYVALSGPNFESPAEIRMWRILGGDAVGMSTAPEAQIAHHAGMQVLAFSTITNMAIADLDAETEPTHEEVVEAGKIIVPQLTRLLMGVLGRL